MLEFVANRVGMMIMMAFCSFAIVPLEHWEHDVVDAHASVAYSLLGRRLLNMQLAF